MRNLIKELRNLIKGFSRILSLVIECLVTSGQRILTSEKWICIRRVEDLVVSKDDALSLLPLMMVMSPLLGGSNGNACLQPAPAAKAEACVLLGPTNCDVLGAAAIMKGTREERVVICLGMKIMVVSFSSDFVIRFATKIHWKETMTIVSSCSC